MKRLFTVICSTILLGACQKQDLNSEETTHRGIGFKVESVLQTRGIVQTTNNINTMYVFGYSTGVNKFSDIATPYIYNEKVVKSTVNGKNIWSFDAEAKEWDGDGYHSFFAYAPADEHIAISPADAQGAPTLTYTMPLHALEHIDLLYSKGAKPFNLRYMQIGNRPVPFELEHALSKITFRAKIDDTELGIHESIKITEVSFANVDHEGTATYILNADKSSVDGLHWENDARYATISAHLSGGALENTFLTGDFQTISTDNGVMFVIPQTFSDNANSGHKLLIDAQVEEKGTGKIQNFRITKLLTTAHPSITSWEQGRAYVYDLVYKGGIGTIDVKATPLPNWDDKIIDTEVQGTYLNVAEKSVKLKPNETFKIYYSTDYDDEITAEVTSGIGTITDSPNSAQTGFFTYTAALLGEDEVTIKAGKLSTKVKIAIENLDKAIYLGENNDITNRANAYMLPLVTEPTQFLVSAKRVDDYWNGDWTTHYASGSGNIFRGDNGGADKSKTLAQNPNWEPVVLWADFDIKTGAQSLFKVAKWETDGIVLTLNADYSTTTVNVGKGGNVIIGVKGDSGEILWSWHVWITDLVDGTKPTTLPATLTANNKYGKRTTFNAYNITTAEGVKTVLDRALGALSSGDPTTVANNTNTDSYGLYYQWGRKDAFPRAQVYNNLSVEATIYTPSGRGTYGTTSFGSKTSHNNNSTVAMSIANPMTFYYYTGTNTDWIGSSSDPAYQKRNRWIYISTDAGGTGTITTYYAKGIKTIFDPCPAGWRVPWGQNWTGINTTQSIYNVTFPWSSHGRIWKPNTSNNTTAGSVHYWFPASGFRMPSSGSFNSIGVNGYYWSGSPATNYNMTALYFDSSTANPINNGAQCSRGYLVRPVRE